MRSLIIFILAVNLQLLLAQQNGDGSIKALEVRAKNLEDTTKALTGKIDKLSNKIDELKSQKPEKIDESKTISTLKGDRDTLKSDLTSLSARVGILGTKIENLNNLDSRMVPIGTIVAFAGNTVPEGWLLCDGRLYTTEMEQRKYAKLYEVVRESFGKGDIAGSFAVPDMRGRFLRGVSGESNADPDKLTRIAIANGNTGNKVGSYQDDGIKQHRHNLSNATFGTAYGHGSNRVAGANNGLQWAVPTNHTITLEPNGEGLNPNETRPKNVYVNFIIKY